MVDTIAIAYRQGEQAYQQGKAIEDCPHKDEQDRIAWRRGWREAKAWIEGKAETR